MYKVKLSAFEGPFDLLVYLIEHARMSIYDIQVSEITTQYLDYIAEMKSQDIAVGQEFMVLAAELIELKSRMLLPRQTQEDGSPAEDPRAGLVSRLLEYKQFREIADFLADQEEAASHVHVKPQEDLSRYAGEEDILLKADMDQFVAAFRSFLYKKQRLEDVRRTYEQRQRQRMTVEARIVQIRDMFRRKKKLLFSEMIKEDRSVINRVVTFMSLLELVKDGSVTAAQPVRYGDITVTLRGREKPAAGGERGTNG